jgi:hypothetical protein
MQKRLLVAAAGTVATLAVGAGPARADVSWQHLMTVRSSLTREPVLRLKVFNNWTPQRHRLLLKYSVLMDPSLPIPQRPFHMTALLPGAAVTNVGLDFEPTKPASALPKGAWVPGLDLSQTRVAYNTQAGAIPTAAKGRAAYRSGGLGRVLRLDDDRIIGYSSDLHSYFSEPRRAILKLARFDPWKKLAPQYSKDAPPAFSVEQRKRLGGEIRAILKPHLKDVWRAYLRELPNSRTFHGITSEGITGRGYRMTWLINGGGLKQEDAQWMRLTFEWWLASEMPGDEVVREFRKAERDSISDIGLPTASLWINETLPILWYTLPEELHRAVETIQPLEPAPNAGLSGTPIYMAMTMKLPPGQGAELGDMRIESMLQKRDTARLAESIFVAPTGYEKVPLQPKLKQYNDMINQQLARRDIAEDEGVDSLGFTWEAMRAYAAATQDAMPAGMRLRAVR